MQNGKVSFCDYTKKIIKYCATYRKYPPKKQQLNSEMCTKITNKKEITALNISETREAISKTSVRKYIYKYKNVEKY